jgi:catechol 2,3-dioxygenase-like lactoylglutathione lyase family enzyme
MLLSGVNHIGLVTDDIDRFVDFYRRVFDATVSNQAHIGEERTLTFIHIGPHTELNVFHSPENAGMARGSMFTHGPIDHIGLQAASREAFDEIRRRLIAEGATDGFVTDFGMAHSLFFVDPDGLEGEVLIDVPGATHVNPPGTPAAGYERVTRD